LFVRFGERLGRRLLRRFLRPAADRFARPLGAAVIAAAFALSSACGASGPRPSIEPERVASAASDGVGESRVAADGIAVSPPVEIPAAAAAAFARATQAMAAETWIEAELELEQLILEYPDYPGPYVNLAIVYRQDGRDAEAEVALGRALAIAPGHPAANNERGVMLREQGEFESAGAAYRRAIGTDSAYRLAHYNLGVLLDVYLRREDEALEHYEIYQALSDEPDIEVGRWIVDLRRRLGLPEQQSVQLAQGERR
jgi:tetratricopeptide (TPR) repeat protein